ncbi:MAG TPA: hypothetical protein VHZ97_04610 [Pseudonocardiaceae bacterium]|nr:hypothetical protein [Pseudonocardiaceae bacterium]
MTTVPDGPDVIVGRTDIDSYAAFPSDGAELLDQLRSGMDTRTAQRWYERRFGEPVDLADFLDTLRQLEFLREHDEPQPGEHRRSPRWQRLGRAAFSLPALLGYAALIGYAIVLSVRMPWLRPNYANFFFTPSILLMELGVFFGQIPGIWLHETLHALAGRRLGIPSRLRLGNRLYQLVVETHLNGLWSVSRRRRYLPLLAGMLGDLVWYAVLTILAGVTDPLGLPYAFPGAFLRALAVGTLLRFAWQFSFYLQTDVYQVLVTALRCVDLHATSKEYLANRVNHLLGRPERYDETRWHPRDRQVARWYVYLFGVGYLLTIGTVIWIGVPTVVRVLAGVFDRLAQGASFSPGFLDACLAVVLNLIPPAIVAVLVIRRRLTAHRARSERTIT